MAEINNSLALQAGGTPLNLQGTLGTISQMQLANAHAGLYGLQAQQEARKLGAMEYLKSNPSDYQGYIQRGGDPSVGSTLQTMGEKERAYAVTPNRLSPESYNTLSSAGRTQAETRKIGLETQGIGLDQGAKIAQGVLADPSNDSVWQTAVDQHYKTFGGSALEREQLLAVKNPQQRAQIAKAYAAQGVAPSSFGAPHNVGPQDAVTTPGAAYAVPQAPAAVPARPMAPGQQGGMIGNGERIIGGAIVQDNGVPVPNQQVASRFGTMPPAMTPAQKAESSGYGEQLAKVLPTLAEKADNSRQANFTLDQMKSEAQTWNMGKGGTALMAAQQYLKPLANSLGSTVFDKPVADFEAFQKNAGVLTRQAVKEVSPRAAVQEFQMIQNQLPSADMSRGGFNQIVDQFQAVNDFNIAKHQAGEAWRSATGSMDKFEAEWNKNITPSAFLVSRLPPEQLGALRANLSRTAEGRATLKSITRQLQWASEHKLDEMVR